MENFLKDRAFAAGTHNVEILAPTLLEYLAVRHVLPHHTHACWAGMRLAR